jgi:hypothetical protein
MTSVKKGRVFFMLMRDWREIVYFPQPVSISFSARRGRSLIVNFQGLGAWRVGEVPRWEREGWVSRRE